MTTNIASCFIQLNEFRKQGKHCDVTITIDGHSFPCHRLVLSSSSSYFSTMFNGSFDENKSNNIVLREVDPTAFAEVLEAMYTCGITLNKENACRVLKACSFLGMPIFEKACITFINDYFPPDNLLEIGIFCNLIGEKDLVDRVVKFVAEDFVNFSKTKEFESLPDDLLITILSQKNLERNEDVILKTIVTWVHKNKSDVATIQKLLEVANLSTISSGVVAKLIRSAENVILEEEPIEAEAPQQKRMRLEVTNSSSIHALLTYVKSRRIDNGLPGTCTLGLNEKGTWVPVNNVSSSLASLKTVVIGKRQYFMGCDKNSTTGITNMFWFVEDDKTIRLREPPITVCRFKLVAIENTIYLYVLEKGFARTSDIVSSLTLNKDTGENAVYSYNCELDMWFSIPRMYTVTYGSAAVTMDRHLYILGGQSDNGTVLLVQRYDHRSPNWLKLSSLIYNQINADACAFEKKIYLSGSYHDNSFYPIVNSYDTIACKWEPAKSMSCGRGNHIFVKHGEMLYVIDNRPFTVNEKYNPISNTWSDVAPIPKKISISGDSILTYEVNDAVTF